MRTEPKKFVLLDRDGVINRVMDGGYVTSWNDFEFLPGSLQGLRLLAQNDYAALVVSNQACVGKGLLSAKELHSITQRFVAEVVTFGGRIRAVYYCPHRADAGCACRKPRAGLLRKAQLEHGFHFEETFVIGDSAGDVEAARLVGSPAVLVSSEADTEQSASSSGVKIVRSLCEAAEFIVATKSDRVPTFAGAGTRAHG